MVNSDVGRFLWLVLVLGLVAAGCSDDGDGGGGGSDAVTGGTGGGGAPDAGSTGGTGGAAQDSGTPTGGTGGTTTDAVECGELTCTEGADLTIIQLGPCCASGIDANGDPVEDVCGAGMAGQGCGQLDTPGEASDACPGEAVLGGLAQLPGCCRPDGQCGVDAMAFGCVARDDPNLSSFGLSLEAMGCGPGAGGADGGT